MPHITEAYLMYHTSHRDQARQRAREHRLACQAARVSVRQQRESRRSWPRWRR